MAEFWRNQFNIWWLTISTIWLKIRYEKNHIVETLQIEGDEIEYSGNSTAPNKADEDDYESTF